MEIGTGIWNPESLSAVCHLLEALASGRRPDLDSGHLKNNVLIPQRFCEAMPISDSQIGKRRLACWPSTGPALMASRSSQARV